MRFAPMGGNEDSRPKIWVPYGSPIFVPDAVQKVVLAGNFQPYAASPEGRAQRGQRSNPPAATLNQRLSPGWSRSRRKSK